MKKISLIAAGFVLGLFVGPAIAHDPLTDPAPACLPCPVCPPPSEPARPLTPEPTPEQLEAIKKARDALRAAEQSNQQAPVPTP